MLQTGPKICDIDQERLQRARTVILLSTRTDADTGLFSVNVIKSVHSEPGESVCGKRLLQALWSVAEPTLVDDHRIIYEER